MSISEREFSINELVESNRKLLAYIDHRTRAEKFLPWLQLILPMLAFIGLLTAFYFNTRGDIANLVSADARHEATLSEIRALMKTDATTVTELAKDVAVLKDRLGIPPPKK